MKRTALLMALLFATACESTRTLPDGTKTACIGINDTPNPALQYKYSTRNIVIGAVFLGTIFTPVLVVLDELKCPVGAANAR